MAVVCLFLFTLLNISSEAPLIPIYWVRYDHIIMDCYSVDHLLALVNMHTSIRINFGLLFLDKVMLYLFIESGVLKSVLRIMSCMDY